MVIQNDTQEDAKQHLFKKGKLFMKRIKNITAIILVCTLMLSALIPAFAATPTFGKKQAHKVSDELLEIMGITYGDLADDKFVDDGTTYSCIIWINDIDKEVAVRAGIDAAEKTRDTYRASAKYDYPYTIEEVNGTKYVEVQLADNENDEYVQTYIEAERAASAELYKNQNGNFVAENFKTRTAEVNYISSYTPCVFVDLTMSRISDLMNQEDVHRIGYWDESVSEDSSSSTGFTDEELDDIERNIGIIKADVAKSQYNVSGEGIKIGQIEPGYPSNSSVYKMTNGTTTTHADEVYTIMHMVAPDATYYAASTVDNGFKSCIEWFIRCGVNIINMSAGSSVSLNTYDERSQWIDHLAGNHYVHFIKSAGNYDDDGVTSPGMAYNIITVGCTNKYSVRYTDAAQGEGSAYNSDTVSRSSQRTYKPDVAAPGCCESTGLWGTSLSAPLVTGTVALLCESKTLLKTRPHLVKAILATSAGDYTTSYPEFKHVGAGVIDVQSAIKIASVNDTFTYNTVSSTNAVRSFSMPVSASAFKTVTLAYDNMISIGSGTHENTSCNTTHYIAELKLEVFDPNGSFVTECSISGANLKVVKVPTTYNGTYTIKITQTQSNSSNTATRFGIAWN